MPGTAILLDRLTLSAGGDIRGRPPMREIKAHSSAQVASPGDV